MIVKTARKYSTILLKAINTLLPQLSGSSIEITEKELKEIISSDKTMLFLAEEEGTLFGILTLIFYRIPTGVKAIIEDVVVSEQARGKGVGTLLMEEAIKIAKTKGAKAVDLTSRPSREAANKLYQKLGFEKRETNVYRLKV
jgi:ribosomal protein S18 acetylase RimI-like enzyme